MGDPAVFRGFDDLSVEIVDVITEKMRQECSNSFQTLGKTSKRFRDSARRCSKSLVVESDALGLRTEGGKLEKSDETGKRNFGFSKLQDEVLSTELSMRPGLKRLVVVDYHFGMELELGSKFSVPESVLSCLSTVPWMTCMVKIPGCVWNSWKQDCTRLLLSASKEYLQELTLCGFAFTGVETVQLLKDFPNLKFLNLGGYACDGEHIKSEEHKKLTELDISGLRDGGGLRSKGSCVSLSDHFTLDLPGLQQLTSPFRDDVPGAATRFRWRSSFPRSLVVLRLKCQDSSQGPPWNCVLKLVARDCPLFQELHLLTVNPKYPECWKCEELVEIAGLPKECPRLKKLRVSQIDWGGRDYGAGILWEYCARKE